MLLLSILVVVLGKVLRLCLCRVVRKLCSGMLRVVVFC